MRRSWRGNLLLSICSLVLALVLTEGLLRLLSSVFPAATIQYRLRADPDQMGVSHPYIGYLHTPHNALVIPNRDFHVVHHTDGFGFRNPWPWPETADIVTVGDSLTFGYGVADDQTWPAILNAALPQQHLINLGLIGTGPEQYARVYETFGIPLHPKFLVVGLFLGNDFQDAEQFERWWRAGGRGNYMVWRVFKRETDSGFDLPHLKSVMNAFLKQHSLLYHVVEHAWDVYKAHGERTTLALANGKRLQLRLHYLAAHTEAAKPERPEAQLVLRTLERLQARATAQGTRVLVVLQPSKEQVYLPLLRHTTADPAAFVRAALNRLGMNS